MRFHIIVPFFLSWSTQLYCSELQPRFQLTYDCQLTRAALLFLAEVQSHPAGSVEAQLSQLRGQCSCRHPIDAQWRALSVLWLAEQPPLQLQPWPRAEGSSPAVTYSNTFP